MFNLVSKRYWFFLISGLVIVPGLLALLAGLFSPQWGLHPGIDFTNGASIDLRFAGGAKGPNVISLQGIEQVFKDAGASDVQVYSSTALSGATPAGQYAFVQFSRPIGKQEAASVISLLQDPKNKLGAQVDTANVHTFYSISEPGVKNPYGLMVIPFQSPVKSAVIQTALAKLPDTDAPPAIDTSSTPAPTGGATPAATAIATAGATATAKPTAVATATPVPVPSATFPVSVNAVQLGANENTYSVQTQTFLEGAKLDKVVATLISKYGFAYVSDSSQVGPAIASETTINAILAVIAASVFIVLYIGIAFRKVGGFQQALRYGACAVIALLHDALVVLGLWAIFGHFFNFKVDTLFVTAILTVIGFSVHDTIVVFDRIRENLARRTSETFEQVVNVSLIQTMSRSLNTSMTVLFTLTALTLFGGFSIREFTLALLIGIASGTYSSIFNASMLLVVWENGEWRRWFGLKPKAETIAYGRRTLVRAGTR
ncbi:MAG TPA: protein translocase subunit SecF [Ktedonobacterales bacterium]|nr:protein translocase subunit SecF [Ktedonobacterales bacterium]